MSIRKKNSLQADYQHALKLEQDDNLKEAAAIYEAIVKAKPMFAAAQHRLMVIYRKMKASVKELKVIQRALLNYKKGMEESQRQWLKTNKQKAELSRELAESLGLLGANGLPLYHDENIEKWEKRLVLLNAKLTKAKTKPTKKKINLK